MQSLQINISQRLIVMDCGPDDTRQLYKMINPEIVDASEESAILEEGCLSIPNQTAEYRGRCMSMCAMLISMANTQMLHCEGIVGRLRSA